MCGAHELNSRWSHSWIRQLNLLYFVWYKTTWKILKINSPQRIKLTPIEFYLSCLLFCSFILFRYGKHTHTHRQTVVRSVAADCDAVLSIPCARKIIAFVGKRWSRKLFINNFFVKNIATHFTILFTPAAFVKTWNSQLAQLVQANRT